MINFDDFYRQLADTLHPMHPHAEELKTTINSIYSPYSHGDEISWQQAFEQLPDLDSDNITLDSAAITAHGAISEQQQHQLTEGLMGLQPWRKGPFELFDVTIDTEWRSDWKWQRVAPHLGDLGYKNILDVGCGSGYHCFRMAGAGAHRVVGIDPSLKFLYQFKAINRYIKADNIHLLPLKCEQLPYRMQCFDTVFSMGVLYHRKSPFDHLEELKYALKPGGQLVLETLVIDGGVNTVLVPDDRYAQMRNVWFLPSCAELLRWVERAGFINAKVIDVDTTKLAEQRSTDWMRYQSLEDFLDPNDHSKTIEGYQAPTRATIIASRK
jgi:tRNA (mo5U34)-methyltransferase